MVFLNLLVAHYAHHDGAIVRYSNHRMHEARVNFTMSVYKPVRHIIVTVLSHDAKEIDSWVPKTNGLAYAYVGQPVDLLTRRWLVICGLHQETLCLQHPLYRAPFRYRCRKDIPFLEFARWM